MPDTDEARGNSSQTQMQSNTSKPTDDVANASGKRLTSDDSSTNASAAQQPLTESSTKKQPGREQPSA